MYLLWRVRRLYRAVPLTALIAFATISFAALTIIDDRLVYSQVQYHTESFTPADVSMPAIETKEVKEVKKEIITYTVANRDTIGIVSEKYNVPWQRIYNKNVTMQGPTDLKTGQELTIPAPDEILQDRPIPAYFASQYSEFETVQPSATVTVRPAAGSSKGNLYAPGNCTWYVKDKRPDLPNTLGNAYSWAIRARAQGLPTGTTPRVGAVGQRGIHVVYIESVNADGTVTFSEMNYRKLYAITRRTMPANYFTYIY